MEEFLANYFSYFFSSNEYDNFIDTFRKNNINEFHYYMEKIFGSDEKINECINAKNLNMDSIKFREYMLYSIAIKVIHQNNLVLSEILLSEYHLNLDNNEFIRLVIKIYATSYILVIFSKYCNLKQYLSEIKSLFRQICQTNIRELDTIKNACNNFSTIGLNTSDLCDLQEYEPYHDSLLHFLITYADVKILKYLLDQGFDFKRFEIEIIVNCVKDKKLEMLEMLIDYGVDVSVLNNLDTKFEPKNIKMYELLTNSGIDPKIIALTIYEGK